MLRERTSGISGSAPEPPKPPVKKGNTITFEIDYTDGEVTLNNSGDGITYTKVTTNLKTYPEVSGAGGKVIKFPYNSKDISTTGEKIIKVKAYVEKYDSDINSFINAGIGNGSWDNGNLAIDFSDFDAGNLAGLTGILIKSGSANLITLTIKNLDAPKLVDFYNKKGGGFWAMTPFSNIFNYDGVVRFTNCKTPALKNISGMFQGIGVKIADLSGLDTTSVTTMEYFFDNCYGVSEFRLMTPVNNLTNMTNAFNYMSGSGTFYYNKNYDYSKITLKGWTRTPV